MCTYLRTSHESNQDFADIFSQQYRCIVLLRDQNQNIEESKLACANKITFVEYVNVKMRLESIV